MPDIYYIIIGLLFVFAILDLMVGVSNDAANFLNSALGSFVAKRKTILIIASLGVFVGATFSSGMMEVARKGIFNPDHFFFYDIMVIFVAVMLTDIILLDTFNTLGLPTSTTVSIVFELLGAAVAVALLKIGQSGEGFAALGEYINSEKALLIIGGILGSVIVAFSVGALIMWFSRLLFSFRYQKRYKWAGGIWAGIALTALTYFLLIKGMKGASFVSKDTLTFVKENTLVIVGISFAGWFVIMQTLQSVFKVNTLKLIVLFGTFSIAMAFAGNDLVNFIGVPVAGFESFKAWSSSGMGAEEFSMGVLSKKVPTNTLLLLGAGLIMVLTLWFSKKARTVSSTEIGLARQHEGAERFGANSFSRAIVRIAKSIADFLAAIIPARMRTGMNSSFEPAPLRNPTDPNGPTPSFDQIRASVNLAVAGMLISFATSLKLPLSTTYVTFMVAMGTSLADRAWGRDSAVFRVSGVLNVISGWFLTAMVAFTISGIFATLIYFFQIWAIAGLTILAGYLFIRGTLIHRRKAARKEALEAMEDKDEGAVTLEKVRTDTSSMVADSLQLIRKAYANSIVGLADENRKKLKKSRKVIAELREANHHLKGKLFKYIKRIDEPEADASRLYLKVYDYQQDLIQSIDLIVDSSASHVDNVHNPMFKRQVEALKKLSEDVMLYLDRVINLLHENNFEDIDFSLAEKDLLLADLEELTVSEIQSIRERVNGAKNSMLYFSILLETKDLVAVAARLTKMYQDSRKPQEERTPTMVMQDLFMN